MQCAKKSRTRRSAGWQAMTRVVKKAGNARGGVARGAVHGASEVAAACSSAGAADESADVEQATCGAREELGNNGRMVHTDDALWTLDSVGTGAADAADGSGGAGAGIEVGNREGQ